jgi:hypothetical protein
MVTHVALTDQSIATGGVDETVDQIHELVVAELTLQETGGTLIADGTEQVLYINDNPLGCFHPYTLFVDLDNMIAGDTTVIRAYYRLRAAGGLQLWDYHTYTGADGGLASSRKLISADLLPTRFGVQVTLQQTAGTYRAYDWEIFTEE